MIIVYLYIGFIGILLFHLDIFFPVYISSTIFVVTMLHLYYLFKKQRVGYLTLLLYFVFALPFIHIIPYIWFNFDTATPLQMWGLRANPYMLDKQVINLTAMIGAVGAIGLTFGSTIAAQNIVFSFDKRVNICCKNMVAFPRSLSMPLFIIWLIAALFLSWITAPQQTIFTAAYTESEAILTGLNFSSSWMFSYAMLAFILSDVIFDRNSYNKKIKKFLFLVSTAYITIWLQLLRGDREILPFVLAAFMMYFLWGKSLNQKHRKPAVIDRHLNLRYIVVISAFIFTFIVSYIIAKIRLLVVGLTDIHSVMVTLSELLESEAVSSYDLLSGTWSAVLLTPLSVAGDYVNGILFIKYGSTYVDLFLSLIPGFIADIIGYTRPITATHGPAWEMTYGLGGTHATVVPFMNFMMAGVFLIVMSWSFVITFMERRLLKHLTVLRLSLLGVITFTIPHWLWYGEKNIINCLIIWVLLSACYKMSCNILPLRSRPTFQ